MRQAAAMAKGRARRRPARRRRAARGRCASRGRRRTRPSAPPPKITGGAISGSTIIAMISPPRRLPSASAAPSPPTKANARPPIAAVPKISGARRERRAQRCGGDRRGQRQRRAGRGPVGEALDRRDRLQRRRPQRQQVERAVLEVALEHPLQREQRGQRQRDPGDAGGDRRQPLRLGAGGERDQRGDRRVEAERQQRAAAAAPGQRQLAPIEHASARQVRSCARARWCALRSAAGRGRRRAIRPPPARCARHQLAEAGRGGARRAARTARRAARARADWRPAAPAPGAAAGRPTGGAPRDPAAASGPARPPPASRRAASPPVQSHLEQQLVAGAAAGLQPVLVADAGGRRRGAPRRPPARPRRPGRRSFPPAGAMKPAMARSRLVLPAPFGPVSATASPAASRQARSPASSTPLAALQRQGLDAERGDHRIGIDSPAAGAWTNRAPASMTTRGRMPGASIGSARREAGRCVSRPSARDPGTDFRAALNRGKDPSNGVDRQPQDPPRTHRGREDLPLL